MPNPELFITVWFDTPPRSQGRKTKEESRLAGTEKGSGSPREIYCWFPANVKGPASSWSAE